MTFGCANRLPFPCRAMPLGTLLLVAPAVTPFAHAADAERIVVMNARLVGRDAPTQDVPVNLLIVGGKLLVVTKDDLVIQSDDVAVDAAAVFCSGNWSLAYPAQLRDPRPGSAGRLRRAAGHQDACALRDSGGGDRQERARRRHLLRLPKPRPNPCLEGLHAATDGRPDPVLRQQEVEQVQNRSPSRGCSSERSCWIASSG